MSSRFRWGRSDLVQAFAVSTLLASTSVGASSFVPLGTWNGSGTFAEGVSADGSAVAVNGGGGALRWTAQTGLTLVPPASPQSTFTLARGISADGAVLVGHSDDVNYRSEAFRWTTQAGTAALDYLPGVPDYAQFSRAAAVSADGNVVAGVADSGNGHVPIRWSPAEGMVSLVPLPGDGTYGEALGVSADGTVIVGAQGDRAFRWSSQDGMFLLGPLPTGAMSSRANGVSTDGLVIVGVAGDWPSREAFSWTAASGMRGLGDLPGGDYFSEARAVSGDGQIVVGTSISDRGEEAFIWDAFGGMRSLQNWLRDAHGINTDGWNLRWATAISADGRSIVGFGDNPQGVPEAWLVRLDGAAPPAPPPQPTSDTDGDGMPNYYEDLHGLDPYNAGDANEDPDFDGLTNLQEYQVGTDPHQWDSDGDGLSDGNEQASGLSPSRADTDNDGLADGHELNLGWDPRNPDTDWDSVVDGFEIGRILRASVSDVGPEGNAESSGAAVSADGRLVAFVSEASNLVPGDTNGVADVFVRDYVMGRTTRVSVASDGSQANGLSGRSVNAIGLDMTPDGRYVVFTSAASNLMLGASGGIYLHDRSTGTTSLVSVTSGGVPADGGSGYPSISADGRYIAFSSFAPNLQEGSPDPSRADIYVHDRAIGQTRLISRAVDGGPANGRSDEPAISADGRHVAFTSAANNLVSGDTNGPPGSYEGHDVFVHDLWIGVTTRVSVSSDGTQANGYSAYRPAISVDGRYIAFESTASNLVFDDTNNRPDIFLHDRQTGETRRVSVGADGSQADDYSAIPMLSSDGRHVLFRSAARNFVSGVGAWESHVYLKDMWSGAVTLLSISNEGTLGTGDSGRYGLALTPDARYAVFNSEAGNLVPGDRNYLGDVLITKTFAGP